MERRIYWRGLTLVCCTLVGLALAVAAFYRYPPSTYRGLPSRGRSPVPQEARSDFRPITSADGFIGLLEYAGSAVLLWTGPILWWRRNRPGMPRHELGDDQLSWAATIVVLTLLCSITLGIIMTLISINALLGACGALPS